MIYRVSYIAEAHVSLPPDATIGDATLELELRIEPTLRRSLSIASLASVAEPAPTLTLVAGVPAEAVELDSHRSGLRAELKLALDAQREEFAGELARLSEELHGRIDSVHGLALRELTRQAERGEGA